MMGATLSLVAILMLATMLSLAGSSMMLILSTTFLLCMATLSPIEPSVLQFCILMDTTHTQPTIPSTTMAAVYGSMDMLIPVAMLSMVATSMMDTMFLDGTSQLSMATWRATATTRATVSSAIIHSITMVPAFGMGAILTPAATTCTMDTPMMPIGWEATQSFTDTHTSLVARREVFLLYVVCPTVHRNIATPRSPWFTTMVFLVGFASGPTGLYAARLNVELQVTNIELASVTALLLHWCTPTAMAMIKKPKLA